MPLLNPIRRLGAMSERGFLALLLLVFGAVSIQYTLKIVDPRDGKQDRSAILRWREQLLDLDGGENIYARSNYPNPPIMAILLRPLADLPPIAGALTWFYLKVAMTLAAFALTFRLAAESGVAFPTWAKALAVLMSLRPIMSDLTHGNVNLFILFLVVVSLSAFRIRWDLAAGIVLALAIACKVTPALFVPYFAYKRAWRLLAGVGIGFALFFFVIPAAVLGWDTNATLLASWVQQMVVPFLVGGMVTPEHNNQSLPGLIHRLLTASPSFSIYVNDVYTPTTYHNLVDLDSRQAGWIVRACMAAFSLVVVLCCRTGIRDRAKAALAAEYSLIVLGMLLFSERTWKHHAVTLMLPYAVLCYALATQQSDRSFRKFIIAVLVAAQVCITATSTGLLPDAWAKLAQVYGAFTWAFIILVAALAVCLLRREQSAAAVSADSICREAA